MLGLQERGRKCTLCTGSKAAKRKLARGEAMHRRDFLRSAGVVSAGLALPKVTRLFAESPASAGWRTFDLTTRVEILKPSGTTRIWLPAGLLSETPFQKTLSNTFRAEGGAARMIESKAHAIYEWIVDNTFRDPKTPGCGLGDIRFMLETNDLGGKCADINALYVGLAWASGLPARDAYGIRVAKSE